MNLAILIALVVLLPSDSSAMASNKFTVKLTKCVDGDTAYFSSVNITRFLYVDTPESTNQTELFGPEAAAYTCKTLQSAKLIQLQYDGPRKDKYNRTLAWVWVNGELLQKKLIAMGYVEKFYDYGNYSYENELIQLQNEAKLKKVGLWGRKFSNGATNFINCDELRIVYPKGVPKGHPAYNNRFDHDHDNYACEL
jgi:micrococcal nuclease